MRMPALALVALTLAPALALSGACGEAFTSPGGAGGTGTGTGGGGGAASSSSSSSGSSSSGSSSSSSGTACADKDQDGVTGCEGDCDDDDPSVYPGNAEICGDAKDNDCQGGADDICMGLGTFVSELGDNGNPGTKLLPVATIKKGMDNARAIGHGVAVYVADGDYPEDVELEEGISLYGGYSGQTWIRDPQSNVTLILPQSAVGVYADDKITRATVIDGFHIRGKDESSTGTSYGAAMTLDRGTPTVTGNVITGPTEGPAVRSIGVAILGPANDPQGALLDGNHIAGGEAVEGGTCAVSIGVRINSATVPGPVAVITGNRISSGSCRASRAIESSANGEGTLIQGNDINAGVATGADSFGIVVGVSQPAGLLTIDRNRINADPSSAASCTLTGAAALGWCGGIDSQSARIRITNNVIFGVEATRSTAVWLRNFGGQEQNVALHSNYLDGAGLSSLSQSAALVLSMTNDTSGLVGRIRNNILMGGKGQQRFGVFEDSQLNKTGHPEKLENNLFFFLAPVSSDTLYRSWDGVSGTHIKALDVINGQAGAGANLNLDPMVDSSFHLELGSPCVDTGTPEAAPGEDMDEEARPKGSGHDIGPDER